MRVIPDVALLIRAMPARKAAGYRRPSGPHDHLVQVFALQPHLHIEFEIVFPAIRTYSVVNLELLIVFVHLELAARTSLSLNRGNELCAFVLSNLAIGERRQGR
jgi:hypothetical protein